MSAPNLILATIIANIVEYSRNDYYPIEPETVYPEDVVWNCAYICACFIAQNTVHGQDGVDREIPLNMLKIDQHMSMEERVKLALALVEEFGGQKVLDNV